MQALFGRRARRFGLGMEPALFFTDDNGSYCTRTRDVEPSRMRELEGDEDALERVLALCRENTSRIWEGRLDLPSVPPHILPPNLWWATRAGSTICMPVGDASDECFGLLALMTRHGVMVVDHDTGEPAGDLEPFVRSGGATGEKAAGT